MEEEVVQKHHDGKDNQGSSSPDSGVCDLDTHPEDNSSPPQVASPPRNHPPPEGRNKYGLTFDPFFVRYTDNRRLTLLKSLSQDSEYSLDTSLFDAEEFLQDMGFAGTSDPTIPERFLPSLMQRLSKFPESEMESLHDRIIQSIGCFRRKEGKRRLFRNLSMGKDSSVDHYGNNLLACPSNNYPLLRSNTGPAEFPFDDTMSSAYDANNSLKSGRLSSNDSGHHSMDSLKNEDLPESPIAILVSAASVEQEEKDLDHDTDKGVQVCLNEDDGLVDLPSSESTDTSSAVKNTSDGEFTSTVQELQKLTDDICCDQDIVSRNKSCDDASETTEASELELSIDENDSSDDKCVSSCTPEENSQKIMNEICEGDKIQISTVCSEEKSALSENGTKSFPAKRPLRRISNAQSYNPLKYTKGFGSFEKNSKIDEDGYSSVLNIERPSAQVFNTKIGDSVECDVNPFKNSNVHDTSEYQREGEKIFKDAHELNSNIKLFPSDSSPCTSNNICSVPSTANDISPYSVNKNDTAQFSAKINITELSSSKMQTSQLSSNKIDSICFSPSKMGPSNNMSHSKIRIFNKPKFTRDDSLTNFLSSMLDTSEGDSFLKPPVTPTNSLGEIQSKSDSEILQDNISSSSFVLHCRVNKARSTETLNKEPFISSFSKDRSILKNVHDKAPNRKRRVLRRMSSSLQCCDDENCVDPDRLTLKEDFHFPPTNPFISVNTTPKQSVRHTKSNHHVSGHRAVSPCNSLPALNFYNTCKTPSEFHCNNPFDYTMQKNVQSNSDPEGKLFCPRKKEKRNCKKRRYFSCPSEASVNLSSCPNSQKFLNSNRCDLEMNKCVLESCFIPEANNFINSSLKQIAVPGVNLCKRCTECDRTLQRDNVACCKDYRNLGCCSFQQSLQSRNDMFPISSVNERSKHYMWNSTPDVRYGCYDSSPMEYHGNTQLSSSNDFSMNRNRNFGISSPFCEDTFVTDDVFYPDRISRSFPFYCDHCLNAQTNSNKKSKVRMPQRQNSMSIDDPEEHMLPSWNVHGHSNCSFQNSIPNKNGCLSEDCCLKSSSLSKSSPRKISAVTSVQNIPECTSKQKKAEHRNDFAPISSEQKHLTSAFEDQVRDNILQPCVMNNKNEAFLERKIRIFSKFFTNLGNLSKSIQDRNSDNKHKEIRDSQFCDVIGTDKQCKSNVQSGFCALPPRKCSTPPPEFDRLINLLKNTNTSDIKVSETFETNKKNVRDADENRAVYENRVVLQAKPRFEGNQRLFKPVQFTSSVSMYINSEENGLDSHIRRKENISSLPDILHRDTTSSKSDESSRASTSQISFKVVTRELEDLQQSIQKAKEMRISASKELHLLQELLSGDDGNSETSREKRLSSVYAGTHPKDSSLKSSEVAEHQTLKDLREKSQKEVSEDTSFWQEEIKKIKEETNKAWQEKLDRMEARLASQEEELRRLQLDNENLHKTLDSQRLGSPICHCKSENGQNGFGRIDSAFEDDEEYFSHKPSIPIQSTRQECDRLQERLTEEEQRADQLKLLLNQKLIEFNKLQITLSKQTKEMIELEKSYLQLQCRLRRGTSKPVVARLCSRTSPFASKNLCPKPSPPATPKPNAVS
ncbi:uncharacterized protein NPIL_425111 [Nephila pilipes]|uniref:Uncharacterized protein n=1 Tax=Nephila pilipes TaxID=299642 RepID=A0A8X6T3U5_NEPPI|nr:uncharacterized protein NPIL_425111 [Nephila pilipes]